MTQPIPFHKSQTPKAAEQEDEISLSELFAQLFAKKRWIIAATLAMGIGGSFFGQLPPDVFQASSLVQIERRADTVTLPAELVGELLRGGESSTSQLATEIHIIRSSLILSPVVEALALDIVAEPMKVPLIGELVARRKLPFSGFFDNFIPAQFIRAGESMRVARFDFPPGQAPFPVQLEVLENERVAITLPDGERVEGAWTAPITLPGGAQIEVQSLRAGVGREFAIRRTDARAAARSIAGNLDIRERGSSGIVDFRFSSADPQQAATIINAVVAAYQDHNLRRRSAQIDQSINFIDNQLPELRAELRRASAELAEYRSTQDRRELSLTTQDLLAQTIELETAIEDLGFRREQLLLRLTPNHPDYLALQAEEDRLRLRLGDLRELLADVPEAEQELARLTQQVERARQLELQLVNRIEQLRILRASTIGNIFVLEPAERSVLVGPDRLRPILVGLGLGFVLSALSVFLINFFRRGIEDARVLEELNLSLFATVSKSRELSSAKASDPIYAMALELPRDTVVEAVRGLRTGLRFSLAATANKSLMITSCAPGDGKSFIALNLAIVSAQAGARVLLIDGDMRRGFLRQQFGMRRKTPGLSDVLSGQSQMHDVIVHSKASGLDFMPNGVFPPNPAELLASDALPKLLDELAGYYDLVIIDAPPVLAVADPGIIGQHVGMSLLVVRHLVTTKSELVSVTKTLENAGVAISGCVLNQFDQSASRYGAYGSKYGYYYGGYRYKYD
jgi:tyrosine-protein kinase Etk/Wzc